MVRPAQQSIQPYHIPSIDVFQPLQKILHSLQRWVHADVGCKQHIQHLSSPVRGLIWFHGPIAPAPLIHPPLLTCGVCVTTSTWLAVGLLPTPATSRCSSWPMGAPSLLPTPTHLMSPSPFSPSSQPAPHTHTHPKPLQPASPRPRPSCHRT